MYKLRYYKTVNITYRADFSDRDYFEDLKRISNQHVSSLNVSAHCSQCARLAFTNAVLWGKSVQNAKGSDHKVDSRCNHEEFQERRCSRAPLNIISHISDNQFLYIPFFNQYLIYLKYIYICLIFYNFFV